MVVRGLVLVDLDHKGATVTAALRALMQALEQVYAGDQSAEAGCVLDALADLGWGLIAAPQIAVDQARTREAPRGRVPDTGSVRG